MARKILLADDSVTAQNMGRRILIDAGYEVVTVNNGSAALKKIFDIKPDLIVLDVYMPGYGGLEICQRVRENPETARIPVLLTVGKLEPFKADESRRVRADAFIIKPFEASELLTALTRLEDKIVPSGQKHGGGRFARAMAEIEDAGGRPIDFGDTETGWKNRLKIPPPHAKGHHESHEAEAAVNVTPAEKVEAPPQNAAPVEIPEPPSVLAGVTPDEIAAITAAVAAFSSEGQIHDPQPIVPIEIPAEPAPIAKAETPASAKEEEAAVTFASAPPVQAEPVVEAAAPVAESKTEAEATAAPAKSGEDEVAAALASLAPTNGNGAQPAENASHTPEPLPAAAMATAETQTYTGPRWLAEEVPVPEEEASWSLEAEMSKSFAAFAAADAARTILGVATAEFQESAFSGESAQKQEAEQSAPADAIAHESVPAPQPEAAYAAAASASSVATEAPVESPVPVVAAEVTVGSATAMAQPSVSGASSELAAAWASWKTVRESMVGQIPETLPAAPEVSKQEDDAPAQTAGDQAAGQESTDDTGAIASIVDSVLAELKPKLMEEISRKMGKDKKKTK